MNREKGSKLKNLLKNWPSGAVYTASWLTKQGIGDDLLALYRKSGWVKAVGRGAVGRAGDRVDWTGGVYALQEQLGLPIHIGGKTALEMQGYAHFLPLGKGQFVWLYGSRKTKLPAWFRKYVWGHGVHYVTVELFGKDKGLGLTSKNMGTYQVALSAAERAILELLHLVPNESSYEGAFHLMEGLTTLRHEMLQTLLERCWSVKVKRLFLYMAEKCNHPWVSKLVLPKVDLGKGSRLIVKGGRYDPKYQITVPA